MADDPVPKFERILTDVDKTLRRRLATLSLGEPDHIILAIAPNGAAVIRSNCGPDALREMARMVVEIVGQVELSGQGKLN